MWWSKGANVNKFVLTTENLIPIPNWCPIWCFNYNCYVWAKECGYYWIASSLNTKSVGGRHRFVSYGTYVLQRALFHRFHLKMDTNTQQTQINILQYKYNLALYKSIQLIKFSQNLVSFCVSCRVLVNIIVLLWFIISEVYWYLFRVFLVQVLLTKLKELKLFIVSVIE